MTYELYCETYEDDEIIDNELVDVCGADSFEDCMKQFSGWEKFDLADNEKFCVKECLEDLYEPNYYYPFESHREERTHMKKLEECRAYFEDVFMDMVEACGNPDEERRFNTFEETLTFIYGDEYKRIAPHWKQDALNKYFSAKYEGVTP